MYLPEPHIREEPAWGAHASRADLGKPGPERMRTVMRPDPPAPRCSTPTPTWWRWGRAAPRSSPTGRRACSPTPDRRP